MEGRKGVDIILWAGYLAMELNLEKVVSHYADMGIKGFKIDFLNRDDQEMIAFMYRTAKVCAAHKMLVDFHGLPQTDGMQRTYPNVVNYEAVFGLEQLKWSNPMSIWFLTMFYYHTSVWWPAGGLYAGSDV